MQVTKNRHIFEIEMVPLRKLLVLFVAVQLLILISLSVLRFDRNPAPDSEDVMFHLQKVPAIKKYQYLSESQLRRARKFESGWASIDPTPSLEYEKTRRRLRLVVEEMWYFMGSQLRRLQEVEENRTQTNDIITEILHEGMKYKRTALHELEKLANVDGYAKWRSREAAELSDLVQRRLRFLQNPRDCRKARKLICDLRKSCGFGCQLHHVVYCLITAYGSHRTMILFSKGWRYNEVGWEAVFQPLSETCTDAGGVHDFTWDTTWNIFKASTQVVNLPILDVFDGNVPPHLPRAVPKDLAGRISKLHEVPAVWWVGQMVKYLMRLQPRAKNMTIEASLNMTFKHPIVGVHIRRSDKLNGEAAFHSVDEYMSHVEEYYEQLSISQKVNTKRIYLASDDVKVFDEMRQKYPDYSVVGNRNVSEMAAGIRYCSECLDGLVVDLHLLASSDFLVCTFSSQICRASYEIMQSLHPDAAARFRSLDELYYFGGGGMHRVVAVMSHRATSEDQMDLQVGDFVKIFGNLWNGFSEGLNFRTGRQGLFPSYKVEEVIEVVDFPSVYPRVHERDISSDIRRNTITYIDAS